ncbi:hypothetical protein BH10PSE12_BH10PSE12_18910 [soil metagenome]
MTDRRIILDRLGSGFSVRIDPPLEGEDLNGDFDSYRNARGWAGGVRMTRGWLLMDQTGEHPI